MPEESQLPESFSQAQMPEASQMPEESQLPGGAFARGFAAARAVAAAQPPPLTPFKSRLPPPHRFTIDLDNDSGPATGHPVVQKDKKGLISCLTCGTRMWLV